MIDTRNTTADKLTVGSVVVETSERGKQYRYPVTGLGPCLTDPHSVHVMHGVKTVCYSTIPPIEVAL